jgi:two-component system alkaline phosphatase synthesis response regulator PhoP
VTNPGFPERIHVLVADDEPHIEQGPFRITLVYDGAEALRALEQYPDVALVLLDLMMPNLSGLDVLTRMRADARWAQIPCVILTAAGQDQRYESAMALGVADYITKPFSPRQLFARVVELTGAGPVVS